MTGSDPAHNFADVAKSDEGFYKEAESRLGAAEQGKDEKGWSAIVNGGAEGQYFMSRVVSASINSSKYIKGSQQRAEAICSHAGPAAVAASLWGSGWGARPGVSVGVPHESGAGPDGDPAPQVCLLTSDEWLASGWLWQSLHDIRQNGLIPWEQKCRFLLTLGGGTFSFTFLSVSCSSTCNQVLQRFWMLPDLFVWQAGHIHQPVLAD